MIQTKIICDLCGNKASEEESVLPIHSKLCLKTGKTFTPLWDEVITIKTNLCDHHKQQIAQAIHDIAEGGMEKRRMSSLGVCNCAECMDFTTEGYEPDQSGDANFNVGWCRFWEHTTQACEFCSKAEKRKD